jgi:hypothetical protein
MFLKGVRWYLAGALALLVCASSIEARPREVEQRNEELVLRHPTVSCGFNLDIGYLAGDAVTDRLAETKNRFLGGGGIRLEYRLAPVVRVDCGFDVLFGWFYEYRSRGRGYSYSIGCRFVHQPYRRSSFFLRGEVGTVMLGNGSTYENRGDIDRSCFFARVGLGQQYYVTSSNLTHVEILLAGIRTADGKVHPYVGQTEDNVYYVMLRITWAFGF